MVSESWEIMLHTQDRVTVVTADGSPQTVADLKYDMSATAWLVLKG